MAAAATDSGGETGYESNDSSNLAVESPKIDVDHSPEQQVTHPIPCFNFSSLSDDVLEPPAGLSFVSVLPMDDQGYSIFPHEDLKCKMRSFLRRSMRWQYLPGIIPKVKDFLGERKLRIAANLNNAQAIQELLDKGVDPRASDKRQRTALHFAACKGYSDIVKLLLERGADPNQKDAVGNTPLHLAACTSHISVITLLLKHGADPRSLDNSGRSPLQLAQSKLRLLQVDKSRSSQDLKSEVLQVINMLHMYLHKAGMEAEAELISTFSTRLNLSQSKEEADDNVRDLLSKLSNLSLKRDA